MEIWDNYFYGEEIPCILSEIVGTCCRVKFWAREAGEADPKKFELWNSIAEKHLNHFWPESRYMSSKEEASAIYSSLNEILWELIREERKYRTPICGDMYIKFMNYRKIQ